MYFIKNNNFERKIDMKKVLAFLLTAILAVTAFTAAAATPSPEKLSGVIVSVSAKNNTGKSFNVSVKPAEVEQTVYTSAFEDLKKEAGTELKIVDQKKLVLEGGATIDSPLTVELSVPGVKASSKVYILFKNAAGEVVKLAATAGDGKVTATFTEIGEFVLVTDAQTVSDITNASTPSAPSTSTDGAKEEEKSPQTGDNATPIAIALLAVSAVAAVVSVKKIRTAE